MTFAELDTLCSEGSDGLYLNLHVQPGARRPSLRGLHGDAVKIAIAEAAQDGKANRAVVRLLADALALPRSGVEITAGLSARRKRVLLHDDPAQLRERLLAWLNGDG